MKPSMKVTNRMLRTAIRQVAKNKKQNSVDLETLFNTVRSALAHLHRSEHYRGALAKQARVFLERAQKFLENKNAKAFMGEEKFVILQTTVEKVKDCSPYGMTKPINVEDIRLFLEIITVSDTLHQEGGYTPSVIVSSSVRILAEMMVDNFEAYDGTLNHIG